MMTNEEISSKQLLEFLKGFKQVMETKLEQSEKKADDTTARMEAHLGRIDLNFEGMKKDINNVATKNEKDMNKLTNRLSILEEDMKRMQYARRKSPDRRHNNGMTILPVGRNNEMDNSEHFHNTRTSSPNQQENELRRKKQDMTKDNDAIQPAGRCDGRHQPVVETQKPQEVCQEKAQMSWAEEMEQDPSCSRQQVQGWKEREILPS